MVVMGATGATDLMEVWVKVVMETTGSHLRTILIALLFCAHNCSPTDNQNLYRRQF